MKITAILGRSDIFRMNLHLLPRMRGTWVVLAIIWIFIAATVYEKAGIPNNVIHALLCLLCTFVGAILMMSILIIGLLFLTLTLPQISGVIGHHEYEITDQGFIERNKNAETLSFWHSIKEIVLAGSYIYVRINAYQFVIIPRRGFATQQEFENYCQNLKQFWHAKNA